MFCSRAISTYIRTVKPIARQFSVYDLFLNLGNTSFQNSTLTVTDYPFKPSQIYPSKVITPSDIKEIHCSGVYMPPTVLLKEREELIFIATESANRLLEFGTNIPYLPYD